ncbi:aspartate aminotransferase [Rugosibacter aromaticivorans]|uniref:cysteine-S-conjugate beta-lyase n=1 Tax=Rugosibacter aromaticivorans TaxID=1565605 RepID=A0A0C5IXK4_9PROT|nr:PatB family C-S lyase [Rugosibacter aromaticivorans]AJP47437.1 aspartate aminotransferase [Rugosibacter aromaticivorans]
MNFDFDVPQTRAGTDSEKWAKYAGRDILPLWVADMDFAAPPAVITALHARVAHGVFGYNQPTAQQTETLVNYLARQFAWTVAPEWIVWLPGLVSALNVVCRAVGEKDDAVFTATPIYPPFLSAPKHAERRLASVPLVQGKHRWEWDFDAVDAALEGSSTFESVSGKLFLLCHPHNPTGRAWQIDELTQLARLAEKHDLVICSDEIHNGLILSSPSHQHRVFATLGDDIAARTITLMAPSKTFNIPGLGCAFAVISDAALRRKFTTAMRGIVPHANALGMAATEAAYRACDDWQAALLDYLRGNARAVENAVAKISGLAMHPVEATYLAWIDAREFAQQRGIANPAQYFEAHGLGLSDGTAFGAPGFIRLNFGTRHALLDEALTRLAVACQ